MRLDGNRPASKSFRGFRTGIFPGAWAVAILLFQTVSMAWAAPETIRVAAAADMMPVLPELVRQFTEKTKVPVRVSYGASGELALEIRHRAPFDLFLSADAAFPEMLSRQRLVVRDSVRPYARGILVLWISKKALASEKSSVPSLSVLRGRHIRRIVMANPRLAPYGKAAMRCLISRKMWRILHKKVVYGNSLAQVAQYLKTKTAEAGFLSQAQALDLSIHSGGDYVAISPSCVPYLEQKMAIVKSSPHLRESLAFEKFMLEPASQAFLKSHGYH